MKKSFKKRMQEEIEQRHKEGHINHAAFNEPDHPENEPPMSKNLYKLTHEDITEEEAQQLVSQMMRDGEITHITALGVPKQFFKGTEENEKQYDN